MSAHANTVLPPPHSRLTPAARLRLTEAARVLILNTPGLGYATLDTVMLILFLALLRPRRTAAALLAFPCAPSPTDATLRYATLAAAGVIPGYIPLCPRLR